jgi:ADP-ribose pyrophosphatase YjhB (NUDIX family)
VFKLLFRVFGSFFSRWISTDQLADTFPVSVKALIKDQDRYLLLQNERGEWDFPGGKLETGAAFGQTLLEEVLEETNLNIELEDFCYLEQHRVNRSWVVIAIYRAKIDTLEAIQISHEHMEFGFFTREEVKLMNTPTWVKSLINNRVD